MSSAHQIAVVGAGEDGSDLARRAAMAGLSVRLYDPDPAALSRAHERIRADVAALLAAGAIGPADQQRALDGILATSDLDEALNHADVVVDADAGSTDERRARLLRVGDACRASALVATCGGEPDALIDWLPHPGRLVGLRLRPPPVAAVAGVETAPEALDGARRFAERLAQTPDRVEVAPRPRSG